MAETSMRERVNQAITEGTGFSDFVMHQIADAILPLIEEAVTAKRERCAQIAEEFDPIELALAGQYAGQDIAAAIRGGDE